MVFLVVPFFMLMVSTALAQPAEPAPVDLKAHRVFSVLYSSTEGRALVGILDSKIGMATYAECQVSAPDHRGGTRLGDFRDCLAHRDHWFPFSDENLEVVGENFERLLEANYESAQREALRSRDIQIKAAILSLPFALYSTLFAGLAVGFTRSGLKYVRLGQRLTAWSRFAGTAVGLLGLAFMGWIWHYLVFHYDDISIPPIEESLRAELRDFIRSHPEYSWLSFSRADFRLSYQLMRDSLLQAVERVSVI